MKAKFKEIYNEIKKYNTIYIVRHIGPDPDAISSQIALRESIKETFPKKNVYALGTPVTRLKFLGKLDKMENIDYNTSLLIVIDTPDIKRIDMENFDKFKNVIKIDHHPFIDDFNGIELINSDISSVAEIILDLIKNTKLKMTKAIAEIIFVGIVSDSYRFLFDNTKPDTFIKVGDLIKTYDLDIQKLYNNLYTRPLSEIRLMGYIETNLKVTKNKFAYIQIDEDIIKSFGTDSASTSKMINSLNNIEEMICWMFILVDNKNDLVRFHIRSRGPIINELAMKYGGGGHKLASGIRTKDKTIIDDVIKDFDKLCKEYNEKQ